MTSFIDSARPDPTFVAQLGGAKPGAVPPLAGPEQCEFGNALDLRTVQAFRRPKDVAHRRVDARVLQVLYRVERDNLRLFVGRQVDVFIDAAPEHEGEPLGSGVER